MGFARFVEVGRVVLVEYGTGFGKTAVIVDVLDQNKCMIDGPTTGVARQLIAYKRIALTDFTIEIPRGASSAQLEEAIKANDVLAKFAATSWGKKLDKQRKRAELNDFDRFKLMVAKKEKSRLIAKEYKKLKKAAKV
ncbi:60S ribosomal protein L14 [Porphyridium purpureum]|uniref:60S ribosomal protein L14 n=1 Tax=Porphyridium purpureum TaxID=35688 RepID=A0A5J4YUC3_PORPP|nr:60S ribosomal protein L14 [Porphyridium purpureum]|eukprot:POR2361..scf229_5